MYNKKAQAAESITWIVATVIIFVIILLSVYLTSIFAGGNKVIDSVNTGAVSSYENNFLIQKSVLAYLLTKNPQGNTVFQQLQTDKKFDDFSSKLAKITFANSLLKDGNQLSLAVNNVPVSGDLIDSYTIIDNIKLDGGTNLEVLVKSATK